MDSEKLLIKGGRIIDPSVGIDRVGDLLLAHGHVARIDDHITDYDAQTIEAAHLIVCPGLIDIHVHFRGVVADGNAIGIGIAP